jgi:selenocysteine-specific elongation factor
LNTTLMNTRTISIVIGTAGHIDHGKTMLIRALTGVDTDRLPEEKRRGITIDLGFASLETRLHDGSHLRISFVDVPGHKNFIRNMLAGVGCIDAVMLVISAEEGVMPQTQEHFDICNLLGIRHGLTVITKVDAVTPLQLDEVTSATHQFLSNSFLSEEKAPTLAVSAYSGQGMDELKKALIALASQVPARSVDILPRLPLDRAFVMKGFGTVVTGTLLSGSIREGEALVLEPGNLAVRVRGIQSHSQSEATAQSGSRVALNLAGVDVIEVQRGQTLVPPRTLGVAEIVDVEVSLLPNAPELKHRARVHFHAFTSESMAAVSLYRYDPVKPGTTRLMRIKLTKPSVLLPGDRFVLRQSSPAMTIGGGRVLDAHPMQNLRKAKTSAWLERLRDASAEDRLLLRVARRNVAGLTTEDLASETGVTVDAIQRMTRQFLDTGELLLIPPDLFLARDALGSAVKLVHVQLKKSTKFSGGSGLKRSELKSLTGLRIGIFDQVVQVLSDARVLQSRDELLYPFSLSSADDDADGRFLSAIAGAFESAGLAAPLPADVAANLGITDPEMRRLMTRLLRDKSLVRMGTENLYIHQSALICLKNQIKALRGETMDVPRFKQITGLSRKYAIPLLEHLDREQITRKQGDRRVVL